jgi:PleD family two-component response regulator
VILFPETSAQNAFHICDKLRKIVEAAPWHEIHPDLRVTISMGLCDDIGQGSGETMIARADDKLYEVKRNGKNHVRIWESSDIVGSLVFSQ